ncbi:MAG TPA: CDP-alcohol phosphatidyltransferase family protein [Streptosporangiaceae bacterium]|nr:CDP-alcohol phosphatidyltransferase family protein [Streptosporangiaceae bacterium]
MLKVLKPGLGRLLAPAGRALARTPVTPNMITVVGAIGLTAGALTLFPTGHLFAGTMVCTGFVLSDMLDGALARMQGSTGPFGAFLDSTLDRVGDAAVFGGLAIWFVSGGHDRLLAAVALFCLVAGLLVSYARARAEGLGIKADVGIAERTERLLIGLVATGLSGLGVPYVLSIGLWIVAVLSAITFGQRVYAVRKATTPGRPGPGGPAPASPAPGGPAPEAAMPESSVPSRTKPDTAVSDTAMSDSTISNNTGAKKI